MSENRHDEHVKSLLISTKRGFPVYRSNPSVPDPGDIKKRRVSRIGNDRKGFVIDGVGEVLGQGAAAFYEFEEVDGEGFVKVFLEAIRRAVGLSKTGLAMFELIYRQVQANPGTDEIKLNPYLASDHGISERSYQRGVRELLEREFIFRSPTDGVFFVNIRYLFNGDRLAFVKAYQRKKPATALPSPKP